MEGERDVIAPCKENEGMVSRVVWGGLERRKKCM